MLKKSVWAFQSPVYACLCIRKLNIKPSGIFAIDCNHLCQGEFEVMDIKSSSHRCPVRVTTGVVHHLTINYFHVTTRKCPNTLLICLTSVLMPSFFKVGMKLSFYMHLNNLTVNRLQAWIQLSLHPINNRWIEQRPHPPLRSFHHDTVCVFQCHLFWYCVI